MTIHPVANIFPMMSPDEFQELKTDIQQHGLQEAIWLHPDGRIIDGRNRYRACQEVGVTPEFRTWNGQGSLVAFIVSLNLKRRHLTPLQKAAVGVDMLPLLEEEAKERQREAGRLYGENHPKQELSQNFEQPLFQTKATTVPFSEFQKTIETKKEQEQIAQKSTQKAAELTGTNRQYISDMKRYKNEAPEIYEAAKDGKINGNQAKALLYVAPEKRQEYIEKAASEELSAKEILSTAKQEEKAIILSQKQQENKAILAAEVQENRPIITLADCHDYLRTLADNSVDLLVTDPPYSTDVSDIQTFAASWLPLALSKVKTTGRAFVCIGAYPAEIQAYLAVILSQQKFIMDSPLIWSYKNTLGVTPKMKYNLNYQMILHLYSEQSRPLDTSVTNEMFAVMEINAPDGRLGNRFHTWQKPDELAMRLIKHASRSGDTVLDCFACTGTFLLMAAKMGRTSFGCDNNLNHLQIAEARGAKVLA